MASSFENSLNELATAYMTGRAIVHPVTTPTLMDYINNAIVSNNKGVQYAKIQIPSNENLCRSDIIYMVTQAFQKYNIQIVTLFYSGHNFKAIFDEYDGICMSAYEFHVCRYMVNHMYFEYIKK